MSKLEVRAIRTAGIMACILHSVSLFAQAPDTVWTKTYGGTGPEYAYSVQQTADNGYVVVGYTQSFGAGGEDVFIVKTDANGDTLWSRTYGGTGNEQGRAVQQTLDNGYIIAGITNSFGAGGEDVYLIKTDANGDTSWTRTYGGTGWEDSYSVQQTTDNGYIITGFTNSFGAGGYDVYLIKTNENGDTLWTRTYGGTTNDYGRSVKQTTDGGYIIVGETISGMGMLMDVDLYLIKTDASGNTLWIKTYGLPGTAFTGWDAGWSVQQTTDNGYVIAGFRNSVGAGGQDVWLLKTDADGDTLWTRTYGGTGDDYGYAVQQTTDNGYIIAGWTTSFGAGGEDVYIIKTNESGDTLWTRTYGGTGADNGRSVQQTRDNGYIIAGRTMSFGAGQDDFWLLRIAGAAFAVMPLGIDFGSVPVDSIKTDSVTVTNTGIATLEITSVVSDNAVFTVMPTTGSLPPGASMQFYVTFAPTNPGAETGNIIFTHNADTSPDTVAVVGTGVGGEAANILSVLDIPDDQGRWVRVTWAASLFDQPGSAVPITLYGVWRRIDDERHCVSGEKEGAFLMVGFEDVLEGWDCVGTVPAIQDSVYNFVSPTLGDSNAYGIYYSVFMVTAHTPDPYVWYASAPDSGYSIDNIPPEPPYDLVAQVINSDVLLTWLIELGYPDFSHFAIYRDTVAGFTPSAANQIGTSEVAAYTDSALAVGTYYYVVSAFDVNGNESDYSNELEVVITGIKEAGVGIPAVYALSQNYPNPFKTETGIRYQLPRPGIVTVAIYDVSGQRINILVNEHQDAGYYTVRWDGRSQDSQRVSNGVYFCRMKAGEYISVKKILLTR